MDAYIIICKNAIFFAVILQKRRRAGRRVARPRHLSSDVRLEAILRPNDVLYSQIYNCYVYMRFLATEILVQ